MLGSILLFCFFFALGSSSSTCFPNSTQACYPVSVYRTGGYSATGCSAAQCWWELIGYILSSNSPPVSVVWPDDTTNLATNIATVEAQAVDVYGRLVFNGNMQLHAAGLPAQVMVPAYLVVGDPFINVGNLCGNPITNISTLSRFKATSVPQLDQVVYPVAVYRTSGYSSPSNVEARCSRACDGWWLVNYLLDNQSSIAVTWPPAYQVGQSTYAFVPTSNNSFNNLAAAIVEVQAIDALGRLVYRNASRNCTLDGNGNCDNTTLATRQAAVVVNSNQFRLNVQYQSPFSYCNFTVQTSFPETLVVVPSCVAGQAYVFRTQCNTSFLTTSLPTQFLGTNYGRCPAQFADSVYCSPPLYGWTDNLIMNGKGQLPKTMFWLVKTGTYTNLGNVSGFWPTNPSIKAYPTLRTQLIDLVATGIDTRLLDSFPLIQVAVKLQRTGVGIDMYRFRVEARSTANGSAVGNAIFNDPATSKIDGDTNFTISLRPGSTAPFRFLYFEDSGWDDTNDDNGGPYIRDVAVYLNLNECLDNNGGCDPHRQCIDQPSPPAVCGDCDMGYQRDGLYNCTQTNVCLLSTMCPLFSTCAVDNSPQGYKCVCDLGYNLTGSVCQDINECIIGNDTNGGCGPNAQCFNVQGAVSSVPVCVPLILNCSLAINNGTTACSFQIPNNSGGQNLSVVTRSPSKFDSMFFGPSYDPQRFSCQSTSFSGGVVSCTLPVGAVGQNLAFSFNWCDVTSCYLVDARNAGVFSFPTPTISSNTLKLYPSGSASSSITSATNFGEVVSFSGSNFIGASQLLRAPDYVVAMTNGAVSVPCRLQPTTQISSVVCETPSTSGTGYRFQILLNSVLLVSGNDVYNYPASSPVISSVSGCPSSVGSGTAECPTTGQIMINITGSGFSSTPAVLVGGKICNRLSIIVANSVLQCQLPASSGKLLDVIVITDSNTMSLPASLVSYASPNITSMFGCPGLLSSAFEATECDRAGQSVLTFVGMNFGPSKPTILIGSMACNNITVIIPHKQVQCTAPANLGGNLDVEFVAAGGAVGFPALTLSYSQCKPGTVSFNTPNCTACLAGTYADTFGLANCLPCPDGSSSLNASASCFQCSPGSFASGAMSSCQTCPPGKISDERGSAICNDCLVGTFNIYSNSTSCQNCPKGKFQGSPGSTTCSNCTFGEFAEFEQTSTCESCPKGRFASAEGLSSCVDCPQGSNFNDQGGGNCTLCIPGFEAPSPGSTDCSACRSGYSAPSAGTINCVACVPGRAQGATGASNCSVCGPGTAQGSPGRDTCDPCLPGSYNDGSSPSACMDCEPGKSSASKLASNCDICPVGTFSDSGSKSCAKCIFGYYTSDANADSCLPCPVGATATDTRETCDCPIGYYGTSSTDDQNRTVLSCNQCKKGSQCDRTGVTLETMAVLQGYWRPDPLSERYYPCRNRQLCLGGLNSSCLENREGVLCGVCKEGYTASSSEKACTLCPSQGVSWGYTVLILLALFLVLLLCYFITLKIYNMQQKLLIDLSKEQDANEVVKMQELINEYNVGDEYFENKRQQAYGAGDTSEGEDVADEGESAAKGVEAPIRTATTTTELKPQSALSSVTVQAQHLLNTYLLRKSRNIRKAPNFIYKVKILLGFFQVASLMPLNSGIEWPRQWQGFIVAFSVFNFDFVPWSNLGCATQIDYLDKAMIVGFVPIAVILFLGLTTYVYFRADTRLLIDTQLEIQQRKENSWRQFVKLVLFTIFLLYPFASKITLAVYNCVTVENHSYLVADLTISCEDSKYITIACLNIVFLVLYPLGVPLSYLFLLNRVKSTFRESRTLLQYGFLYDAYANDRWYWEILDMLHKLMLTSLVTFLPTSGVLIASMAVSVGYMILLLLGHPYIRKGDDRFHLWVQVNLYLLALMGQILGTLDNPYNTTFASPDAMEILLSTLLILINIGLLLAFLIIAGRNVRKLYFTVQKTKPISREDPNALYQNEPEVVSVPQQFFAQKKPMDL